jgi:hypothetical protein
VDLTSSPSRLAPAGTNSTGTGPPSANGINRHQEVKGPAVEAGQQDPMKPKHSMLMETAASNAPHNSLLLAGSDEEFP